MWVTYGDICEIGRLLPSMMTGRQANRRAEEPTDAGADQEAELNADMAPAVTDDDLACFLELRSLR